MFVDHHIFSKATAWKKNKMLFCFETIPIRCRLSNIPAILLTCINLIPVFHRGFTKNIFFFQISQQFFQIANSFCPNFTFLLSKLQSSNPFNQHQSPSNAFFLPIPIEHNNKLNQFKSLRASWKLWIWYILKNTSSYCMHSCTPDTQHESTGEQEMQVKKDKCFPLSFFQVLSMLILYSTAALNLGVYLLLN